MAGTLSYEEFIKQAREFVELANRLGDEWILVTDQSNQEYGTYLQYAQKIQINDSFSTQIKSSAINEEELKYDNISYDEDLLQTHTEIINIEYHIVYSISYQVPILYLKAFNSNGSIISLENAWKIFGEQFLTTNISMSKTDLYSILTQMDHPILFTPFLCLHPCRTSDILSNTPNSKNFIVTFISLMGPYVKLQLSENYGIHFK